MKSIILITSLIFSSCASRLQNPSLKQENRYVKVLTHKNELKNCVYLDSYRVEQFHLPWIKEVSYVRAMEYLKHQTEIDRGNSVFIQDLNYGFANGAYVVGDSYRCGKLPHET